MIRYDGWQAAQKVCVVGAGTMGSGIAAHLANLGFDVSLLDISPEFVREAFERAKAARPPHFYLPETAERIRLGNIKENLEWIAEADWVCEAIIEKINAKRDLFAELDPVLRPDAMISTNTSGLEIAWLAEGRSEGFKKRFLGTHFFNPPRYLKLLELIPTAESDPSAIEAMSTFLEDRVARRVVVAKDTPGFIANRFGMWAMYHAIHTAERLQLSVEQVDAITGPFLGRPRSASFRLNDLVGLDIMRDIASNLAERCTNDPQMGNLRTPASMATLLQRGWIGEKAGQGYYRKEGKELMVFDLQTHAYRERREAAFESIDRFQKVPLADRLRQVLDSRDEVGEYLREHLVPVLAYANSLKEEISHSVVDFDRVMKWGFAWEMGPFEMIDAIGADRFSNVKSPFYVDGTMLTFKGKYVALRKEPWYQTLADMPILEEREGLKVRDMGSGVKALSLTTKMGTINPGLVAGLQDMLDSGKVKRFVLTSENRSFSAGYDLRHFLNLIEAEDFEGVDATLQNLQKLTLRLAEFPSVAAVFGHCLGAGTELMMGCAAAAVSAEAQIGLPEAKVGLLPGGGGTALVRLRSQFGGPKRMSEMAHQIGLGYVAANAPEALKRGFLRETDRIVFHPDRLLYEARQLALAIEPSPMPNLHRPEGPLAGMIDRLLAESKAKGEMTEHDFSIGQAVKTVFAKSVTLEDALAKERSEFIELCKRALSVTRIRHMLDTGKPLKN